MTYQEGLNLILAVLGGSFFTALVTAIGFFVNARLRRADERNKDSDTADKISEAADRIVEMYGKLLADNTQQFTGQMKSMQDMIKQQGDNMRQMQCRIDALTEADTRSKERIRDLEAQLKTKVEEVQQLHTENSLLKQAQADLQQQVDALKKQVTSLGAKPHTGRTGPLPPVEATGIT